MEMETSMLQHATKTLDLPSKTSPRPRYSWQGHHQTSRRQISFYDRNQRRKPIWHSAAGSDVLLQVNQLTQIHVLSISRGCQWAGVLCERKLSKDSKDWEKRMNHESTWIQASRPVRPYFQCSIMIVPPAPVVKGWKPHHEKVASCGASGSSYFASSLSSCSLRLSPSSSSCNIDETDLQTTYHQYLTVSFTSWKFVEHLAKKQQKSHVCRRGLGCLEPSWPPIQWHDTSHFQAIQWDILSEHTA